MCDRADEQLYDLEIKHTKSQKEEVDLQKRVDDIKGTSNLILLIKIYILPLIKS
jgi:hypothetical protein